MSEKTMSASQYWNQKFDEPPQTDADKLAVAMMAEYHAHELAAIRKAVEALTTYNDKSIFNGNTVRKEDLLAILDAHKP